MFSVGRPLYLGATDEQNVFSVGQPLYLGATDEQNVFSVGQPLYLGATDRYEPQPTCPSVGVVAFGIEDEEAIKGVWAEQVLW